MYGSLDLTELNRGLLNDNLDGREFKGLVVRSRSFCDGV